MLLLTVSIPEKAWLTVNKRIATRANFEIVKFCFISVNIRFEFILKPNKYMDIRNKRYIYPINYDRIPKYVDKHLFLKRC